MIEFKSGQDYIILKGKGIGYMKVMKKIILVTVIIGILVGLYYCVSVYIAGSKEAGVTTIATGQVEKLTLQTSNTTQKQRAFGQWVNEKKYMSFNDLSANVTDDTVPIFGSSEFNHLKGTPYHPSEAFENTGVFPMIIGSAYNQSLSLSEYLGALAPQLASKKVVLMLSPSWFYPSGVSKDDYTLRFSERTYMEFMKNSDLPEPVKTYVASRSEALINEPTLLSNVKKYNKVYLTKDASAEEKADVESRSEFLDEFTHGAMVEQLEKMDISQLSDEKCTFDPLYKPDWDALAQQAISEDVNSRNNQFFIDDSRWKSKYQAISVDLKDSLTKGNFSTSLEYDDLRCFLDICKVYDIQPLLVCQPMNGYWYDYANLTSERRQEFVDNINKIGEEYGCKVVSFQDKEYEKYFLLDSVHLAGEGWTLVNKEIFQFCTKM